MNGKPTFSAPGSFGLSSAAVERATLFVNHVLSAEPVACERLKAHAGRVLDLQLRGWPSLLPACPPLRFEVTPAGLLDWLGEQPGVEASLVIGIDASNPAALAARAVAGQRPDVDLQGDAALAADVNWLIDNVRWDVRDDLQRLVGPAAAEQIGRVGSAVTRGVHEVLRRVSTQAARRAGPGAG